jgi:hypothetical protein
MAATQVSRRSLSVGAATRHVRKFLVRVQPATQSKPEPLQPLCLPLMQGRVPGALRRRTSRQTRWAPGPWNASNIEHNLSMTESISPVAELRGQAKLSRQSQSAESMLSQTACGKVESRQYTKVEPVHTVPPNPSIEGTASGLRPPAAPHVKR